MSTTHMSVRTTTELITPQTARKYLDSMAVNRRVRGHKVQAYALDMIRGAFRLTHQGIAFNTNGELVDGQHRLLAIVECGIPQRMTVTRNLDHESCVAIDSGMMRSVPDAIRMAGRGDMTNGQFATVRAAVSLPDAADVPRHVRTNENFAVMAERLLEPVLWTHQRLVGRGGVTKGVRALIVRAWYHVDHERLEEFCRVLSDGIPVSDNAQEDQSAIVYRNALLRLVGRGSAIDTERYRKGQAALDYFIRRHPVSKLYGTSDDMFPLTVSMSDLLGT